MRFCTQCGAAVTAEQTFCTRCGAPLMRPPAGQPAASPAAAPDWDAETLTAGLSAPGGRQPAPPSAGGPVEILTQDRPPGRRVGTVIVVAVVLLVLGGGAAATWMLLGSRTAHHTAGRSISSPPAQQPLASTSRPAPASTSSQPAPASAAPASTAPPARQRTVAIGPAARQHAGAQQVAAFLSGYFQAINNREYHRYSALFDPQLRPTLREFESGYRSTRDSDEVLISISDTSAGLAAAVRFRSHQRPADSPTATSCTDWRIILYLTPRGSSYRIVHPPAGYHARFRAC